MKRLQNQISVEIGRDPAAALVKWLNGAAQSEPFVSALVRDSQSVVGALGEFGTLKAFLSADKKANLPKGFWKAYERLNEVLSGFLHVPQIDANVFYANEPVHWVIATDASPLALRSIQVRWVLQLIADRTITKVRRCGHCETWYVARVDAQRFCSKKCRWNAFATDETFRAERRASERKRYRLHTSGKVASKKGK